MKEIYMKKPVFVQEKIMNVGNYISVSEKALKKRPNSIPILLNLIKCKIEVEQYEDAVNYIQQILEKGPCDEKLLFSLAGLYAKIGRNQEALQLIDKLSTDKKDIVNILFLKAKLLLNLNNTKESLVLIQTVLEREIKHPGALFLWASIEYKKGQLEAAREKCLRILKDYPRHIPAINLLINTEFGLGMKVNSEPYTDFNNFVKRYRIERNKNNNFINKLNRTLFNQKDWISNPTQYTTQQGDQLPDLFSYNEEVFTELKDWLEEKVRDYLRQVKILKLRYFEEVTTPLTFNIWSVRLRSGGFQKPHLHAGGWISGVFYTKIPQLNQDIREGALEFGVLPNSETFNPLHFIQPEEGVLVLFPAFTMHRTIPFESSELRICISFDVYPLKD